MLVGHNDTFKGLKTHWLIPSLTLVFSVYVHITFSLLYPILPSPSFWCHQVHTYIFAISVLFHKNYSKISLLNLWPPFFTPNLFKTNRFYKSAWLTMTLVRAQEEEPDQELKSKLKAWFFPDDGSRVPCYWGDETACRPQQVPVILYVHVPCSLTRANFCKSLRIFSIENIHDNYVWFQSKAVILNSKGME